MTDEHLMDNPRAERVKKVAALSGRAGRRKQGLFMAEGPQPVREALKLWLAQHDPAGGERGAAHSPSALPQLDALYFTEEALVQHPDLSALLDQVRGVLFDPQADLPREARLYLREATAEVLAAMSDADTPQGVLAVCRIRQNAFEHLGSPTLAPVLVGLQDPGNVGTLIRTADAAGAGVVVLGPATVDPWSPKVVRAAAGSHFHLPIFAGVNLEQLTGFARDRDIQVLAADGYAETALDGLDHQVLAAPTLWLLGNEAHGLSQQEKAMADTGVRIPLYGEAESLNVAVAGAVCLYASGMAQHHGSSQVHR